MEPLSPPKRMTRARAAAKASGTAASSSTTATTSTASTRAKAATASSKAKATRATATTKRKLRSDDIETDNEEDELCLDHPEPVMQKPTRAVRGRPKKTAAEAEKPKAEDAPAPRPRGRPPKKAAAAEPAKEAASHSSTRTTAAATRTRKAAAAAAAQEDGYASEVPAKKKTTRTRATSTSASAVPSISVRTAAATVATKSVVPKKKVTFEEPEKENIAPKTTAKGKTAAAAKATDSTTAAGLRAKPVRRAASATTTTTTAAKTTGRSTRTASATHRRAGQSGVETAKPSAPLSPKKVTQVRMARDMDVESEDELGIMDVDESHIKPLLRSPSKPAMTMSAHARARTLAGAGLDLESATRDINSSSTDAAGKLDSGVVLPPPGMSAGMLASPARRPPPSPAKDGLMNSPARRLEGMTAPMDVSTTSSSANPTAQKQSVLFSPAKRFPVPAKMMTLGGASGSSQDDTLRSPFKMSLLQTPAKRPSSPTKAAQLLQRPDLKPAASAAAQPSRSERAVSPQPTPRSAAGDAAADAEADSLEQMLSEMAASAAETVPDSPTRKRFPGRMSAVLPRHVDPAVESDSEVEESEVEEEVVVVAGEDPMEIDDSIRVATDAPLPTTDEEARPTWGFFQLRSKDLASADMDSDAEDELTTSLSPFGQAPATPCPPGKSVGSTSRTPTSRGGQSTAKRLRTAKFGFTPLADQLHSWKAHSPSPVPAEAEASVEAVSVEAQVSPTDGFFEDAIAGHVLVSPAHSPAEQMPEAMDDACVFTEDVQLPIFDDLPITDEDLELAEEANEMSLMEHLTPNADDSEASQEEEYGDENAVPIDPVLLGQSGATSSPGVPPVTPQRVMTRTFHTVSKVPLKAADESTPVPRSVRRRSLSVSRVQRRASICFDSIGTDNSQPEESPPVSACGLRRHATVISYSPSKKDSRRESRRQSRRQSRRSSFGGDLVGADWTETDGEDEHGDEAGDLAAAPTTPAKSEGSWSTSATPARTPRRDLNTAMLRGAVVFVDVHTTEGADASGIFVELLTQMGARCVKSWSWNPCSPPSDKESSAAASSSKIGITHVVYKDGGKRTLEKVRESAGVVQCVGVSWVLDCERENQWLDEAPYYIDTSMVPRGGARRRKSMEPRAIANLNGMIVSTPAKQTTSCSYSRECRTAPSTPANRRDSALWVRTPEAREEGEGEVDADGEEEGEGGAGGYPDWNMSGMLTPVPKTPAPEVIARFAASITPSTPLASSEVDEGDETLGTVDPYEPSMLITRTCPPKRTHYQELGEGILTREKDERVLMRLMAARRKSLQFAPKIASPLSKAWN